MVFLRFFSHIILLRMPLKLIHLEHILVFWNKTKSHNELYEWLFYEAYVFNLPHSGWQTVKTPVEKV